MPAEVISLRNSDTVQPGLNLSYGHPSMTDFIDQIWLPYLMQVTIKYPGTFHMFKDLTNIQPQDLFCPSFPMGIDIAAEASQILQPVYFNTC